MEDKDLALKTEYLNLIILMQIKTIYILPKVYTGKRCLILKLPLHIYIYVCVRVRIT